jgi:HEAT repeat protein
MLYSYACTVPNEKVYPIFKKHLQTFGVSKDQHERAAATTILGYIADPDSCLDLVRDDVNPLTNFLVDKMQDESYVVREAAGETVGRFSEHVVPDFLDKHKQIVPCLLRVIKDLYVSKHDMTIQKSLIALNEFVQNLDYDIKIYLEDIIKLLLEYINAQQFSRDVRYWALIALSSTIAAAGKKILPYMQVLLDALHNIITAQGQANTQQSCKGQALMCAGKLASSCGKDKFPTQAIEVFTAFGLECLKEDNKFELKETSISYFSDLTVLIKEEIAPVFDQVMTEILKTCM